MELQGSADEWYLGQVSSQRSLEEIPDKPRVFWEALTFAAIISWNRKASKEGKALK